MLKGLLKFVGTGIKGVLNVENIPIVGEILEEIKSKDGGEGKFQKVNTIRLIRKIARIVGIGLVIYYIVKGDDEKAEKIDKHVKKIEYVG